MRHRRQARILAGGLAIAVALWLSAGCGGGGAPERRFLLVGIDAADWSIIDPLLAEGKLPNLAALMEAGVSCDLRSLEPKEKSPVIWTTIATGKLPDKHGIGGYLDPTTKHIMTSNVRTARTVWDILGESGRTVTVIGWLVSWPAEQVNGSMVTDYFRFAPREDRPLPEKVTYPPELLDEVSPLRVVAADLEDEELARFMSLDGALTREEAQRLPREELFVEMRGIQSADMQVNQLRDFVAGDRSFLGVAKYLMRERPTDAFFVYLRGVDSTCHKFWRAGHADDYDRPVSHTEERVFGETIERYYEFADEMLGELIEEFGEGATVIVCSDHGFTGPPLKGDSGGIRDHGPVGVLVMVGPGVKERARIPEQNVRDITPTILSLHGLPVGEDMDGAVIEEALTPEFLRRYPVRTVPTHEGGQRG